MYKCKINIYFTRMSLKFTEIVNWNWLEVFRNYMPTVKVILTKRIPLIRRLDVKINWCFHNWPHSHLHFVLFIFFFTVYCIASLEVTITKDKKLYAAILRDKKILYMNFYTQNNSVILWCSRSRIYIHTFMVLSKKKKIKTPGAFKLYSGFIFISPVQFWNEWKINSFIHLLTIIIIYKFV